MRNELCSVIVIYERKIEETDSFKSLLSCISSSDFKLHLIIYDNSKLPQSTDCLSQIYKSEYYHAPSNMGVMPAYIYAIDYCKKNNIDWLLRLDQDSNFDISLINAFFDVLRVENEESFSAIIPKIICNNSVISPSIIRKGGFYGKYDLNTSGIGNKRITFINSMSFVNTKNETIVDAIRNSEFLLDLSDHVVAYRLKPNSVYVLDVVVNHSLSVSESEYVGIERYRRIVGNEVRFMNLSEDLSGRLIFKVRLLLRGLKLLSKGMYKHALLTYANLLK